MNNLDELIKQIEALPLNEYLGEYDSDRPNDYCIEGNDLKALAARVQHLEAALKKIADRNAHGVR